MAFEVRPFDDQVQGVFRGLKRQNLTVVGFWRQVCHFNSVTSD
ncbi:MAG: hypothetical protein ACRD5Z_06055 [Bryobacteraceae bacterium]